MRSEPEIFGLISIGELPAVERQKLDPSDFFGREADITLLKADPKAAVRTIVSREWPEIEWDGASSLRVAAMLRLKSICERNRGLAHLRVSENDAVEARKILLNHQANGGISRGVVEQAESVLRKHGTPESPKLTEAVTE